jgi:hypothetical protein
MRASISAIALSLTAVVGLALGPTLTGILSDVFAGRFFQPGDFAVLCNGKLLEATTLAAACSNASFHGLQYALAISAAFWLLSAALYALATLKHDTSIPQTAAA